MWDTQIPDDKIIMRVCKFCPEQHVIGCYVGEEARSCEGCEAPDCPKRKGGRYPVSHGMCGKAYKLILEEMDEEDR